jgi:Ulp1 family protease
VKRWSKRAKVKILDLHKIFIPVHVRGNHWCLAVINIEDKRFEYYDSMQVTLFTLIITSTATTTSNTFLPLLPSSGRAG